MGLVLHVLGTETKASHVLGAYSLMSYIPNDLRADANTEKRPQPEKKEMERCEQTETKPHT